MASKETLGRIRHLGLSSQQRRLRHLHSVSARNIIPKFPLLGDSLVDCLLETYFSLHDNEGNNNAIYTSEKIIYSLNPTWASFELNTVEDCLKSSSTLFMVRIWGGHGSNFSLIIEWKVDLTVLQYLGDQVRTSNHPPNTLIFGLVDGYYGAPSTNSIPKGIIEPQLNTSLKVDMDQVMSSYNKASLQRLRSLQRAIRETQISVQQYQHSIEDSLLTTEKSMLQLSKRESVKLKLKLLREELASKTALIRKEREDEKKMLHTIRKRERILAKKRKEFEEKNLLLREHKQAHVDKRESLVKLNAQLSIRKRQLACELTYIYPIVQIDNKAFFICGVRLPNSESEAFFATDDETLSCALGYACHLVYMICKILEVPQRYAMNPMGSRSTIMDYTIEKVPIKDREFPLHTKGKEKIQFYYGIFLLNKNIAQLRQYCNLPTPNLRNTLPNIKDTLELKFRACMETRKTSITESAPIKTASISTCEEPALGSKIDNNVSGPSISPKKPPLMPKPDSLKGKSVVDGSHPNKSRDTSSVKPPLPPKPMSLRHDKGKEVLTDHENQLLTIVNYDFTTDQDEQQPSLQNIPAETSTANSENKETISAGSAVKPKTQSATHKFFERRTSKKSSRSLSNSDFSVQSKEGKHNSAWRMKRKSLNDLKNVPVEVMREREANLTSNPIPEFDGDSSGASNIQESTDSHKQSHPSNSSNGIDRSTSNEHPTTSDVL